MERVEKILVWFLLAVILLLALAGGTLYLTSTEQPPQTESTVQQAATEEILAAEGETTVAPENTEPAGPVRVACLGDSITYGHGISSRSENSYPAKLAALLGPEYLVENFGVPGAALQPDSDMPIQEEECYSQCLAWEPDVLILMLGTNDSKPQNWAGEEPFRKELMALLAVLEAGEDPPEIWLCTPASAFFQWGTGEKTTSFDIQPEAVDTIARILREAAGEGEYPLIDIHALTGGNPQWFREDGVHPDKAGAAAIARAVFEALTET